MFRQRDTTITAQELQLEPGSYVVDKIEKGKPLLISFAGFGQQYASEPFFILHNQFCKLQKQRGNYINKIFLRDKTFSWYHHGIPELGNDIIETATSLKSIIQLIEPSEIYCYGVSMGATAAIIFAHLLDATHVFALGPQTNLSVIFAQNYNDRRFIKHFLRMEKDLVNKPRFFDISAFCVRHQEHPPISLYFGTKCESFQHTHLDALHALNMHHVPQCALFPYPDCGHELGVFLVKSDQFPSPFPSPLFVD